MIHSCSTFAFFFLTELGLKYMWLFCEGPHEFEASTIRVRGSSLKQGGDSEQPGLPRLSSRFFPRHLTYQSTGPRLLFPTPRCRPSGGFLRRAPSCRRGRRGLPLRPPIDHPRRDVPLSWTWLIQPTGRGFGWADFFEDCMYRKRRIFFEKNDRILYNVRTRLSLQYLWDIYIPLISPPSCILINRSSPFLSCFFH